MSHHLSGPDLRSPKDDPRLDMTDLFVFPAKTQGRTAIILDVNPDPANAPGLHPDAVYQVHVDTDGDLQPDITYHFTFSELDDAGQTVSVLQAKGAEAGGLEPVGRTLADGLVVGMSGEVTDDTSEDHRIAVALRSDPFFADLEGIIDNFNFTGRDAMAEANVYGLVLEVPDSELGDGPIGVWARVALEGDSGWESIDRGANPSVTAYFNQDNDEKIAYNQGTPATDEADHLERFVGVLEHLGSWEADKARDPAGDHRPRHAALGPQQAHGIPQRPCPHRRRHQRTAGDDHERQDHQRQHPAAHRPVRRLPLPRGAALGRQQGQFPRAVVPPAGEPPPAPLGGRGQAGLGWHLFPPVGTQPWRPDRPGAGGRAEVAGRP